MKIAAGLLALAWMVGAAGCTNPGGKVMGDTMMYDKDKKTWVPLIEHRAPDIDELTGIDSDTSDDEETPPADSLPDSPKTDAKPEPHTDTKPTEKPAAGAAGTATKGAAGAGGTTAKPATPTGTAPKAGATPATTGTKPAQQPAEKPASPAGK